MVDTKDSGECSTTAKTVERDDRVVENIGLVFERPHEQLESIEQSLEAVGTWASHTFEQLRPVLQRLRQELLLEFSPTDERLEVFEGLLSLSVDFAKSKPNSYTQLQYVLTQLLKFVNRSIKATEEVARNTSRVEGSSGVNNGSRKGDSGNEVAEWQTVTTRFFRELAQSQSQGDMEHMAQKYLVVVHSIKPNLEVLESAIGLLNRLKAERLEMEQGLDKRTKPQGFVKEAPRAEYVMPSSN